MSAGTIDKPFSEITKTLALLQLWATVALRYFRFTRLLLPFDSNIIYRGDIPYIC